MHNPQKGSRSAARSILLLGPLGVEPVGLPLLVVEGRLVQQVLEGGQGVAGAEDEDGKHNKVQCKLAQEAVLLIIQAGARPAIHKVRQEVTHHGGTAICLLCLHSIAWSALIIIRPVGSHLRPTGLSEPNNVRLPVTKHALAKLGDDAVPYDAVMCLPVVMCMYGAWNRVLECAQCNQ